MTTLMTTDIATTEKPKAPKAPEPVWIQMKDARRDEPVHLISTSDEWFAEITEQRDEEAGTSKWAYVAGPFGEPKVRFAGIAPSLAAAEKAAEAALTELNSQRGGYTVYLRAY